MKIRFIGLNGSEKHTGIFGLAASQENPNGEYPIGHEITLGKDVSPPAGWSGKYEVVSGKSPEDAEFVTGTAEQRGTESKDQADQPRRSRPTNG